MVMMPIFFCFCLCRQLYPDSFVVGQVWGISNKVFPLELPTSGVFQPHQSLPAVVLPQSEIFPTKQNPSTNDASSLAMSSLADDFCIVRINSSVTADSVAPICSSCGKVPTRTLHVSHLWVYHFKTCLVMQPIDCRCSYYPWWPQRIPHRLIATSSTFVDRRYS